jgi:hypothetical protein
MNTAQPPLVPLGLTGTDFFFVPVNDVNTSDANWRRFREECLREDLDPYNSVEAEALHARLLRRRLNTVIEELVDDVRTWNSQFNAEREDRRLLHSLRTAVRDVLAAPPAGDN